MTEFHALSNKDLLTKLKSTEAGLSKKEATKRLESYGPNEIIRVGGTRWYQLIAAQFTNIMVLILIVAGAVSLFVGEHIDAIAIAVIIALNAVIGFIQEYKAEKAVEALQDMAAPHALVFRNKETLKIPAQKLVPGDIIVLEEGMRVPADARVLSATQMEAIEARLTGESHPSKTTE